MQLMELEGALLSMYAPQVSCEGLCTAVADLLPALLNLQPVLKGEHLPNSRNFLQRHLGGPPWGPQTGRTPPYFGGHLHQNPTVLLVVRLMPVLQASGRVELGVQVLANLAPTGPAECHPAERVCPPVRRAAPLHLKVHWLSGHSCGDHGRGSPVDRRALLPPGRWPRGICAQGSIGALLCAMGQASHSICGPHTGTPKNAKKGQCQDASFWQLIEQLIQLCASAMTASKGTTL